MSHDPHPEGNPLWENNLIKILRMSHRTHRTLVNRLATRYGHFHPVRYGVTPAGRYLTERN